MKLPEDKKERTKVLGLMAIGVGATLYVLVRYAIVPIIDGNEKNAKRIAEVKKIIAEAELLVELIAENRAANEAALKKIRETSDKHLLHPEMGLNYKIPASRVVDRIKKNAGIDIGNPMSTAGIAIPGPSLPAKSDLKTFAMNVAISCSYRHFIFLLRTIEEENPYIAVSRVSISGQAKTPEDHRAAFLMSWPIWAEPKMLETLKGAAVEEGGAKEPEAAPEGGKTR